jgi:hypothetical protein
MDTEYTRAHAEPEREALARKIADLRLAGVPWDGPGGIVDSKRLVSSATQGRVLLRRYKLDAAQGGPVEIKPTYDREEINPATARAIGGQPGSEHRRPGQRQGTRPLVRVSGPSPAASRGAGPSRVGAQPDCRGIAGCGRTRLRLTR